MKEIEQVQFRTVVEVTSVRKEEVLRFVKSYWDAQTGEMLAENDPVLEEVKHTDDFCEAVAKIYKEIQD